jgi:hypothetical protein
VGDIKTKGGQMNYELEIIEINDRILQLSTRVRELTELTNKFMHLLEDISNLLKRSKE